MTRWSVMKGDQLWFVQRERKSEKKNLHYPGYNIQSWSFDWINPIIPLSNFPTIHVKYTSLCTCAHQWFVCLSSMSEYKNLLVWQICTVYLQIALLSFSLLWKFEKSWSTLKFANNSWTYMWVAFIFLTHTQCWTSYYLSLYNCMLYCRPSNCDVFVGENQGI